MHDEHSRGGLQPDEILDEAGRRPDAGEDTEAHVLAARSDEAPDAGDDPGYVLQRRPDAGDDTEGHMLVARSDEAPGDEEGGEGMAAF